MRRRNARQQIKKVVVAEPGMHLITPEMSPALHRFTQDMSPLGTTSQPTEAPLVISAICSQGQVTEQPSLGV